MVPEAAVSVIVPAYRAASTMTRALAGVAAQTLRPSQVVVVDDGSDDGTEAAARAQAQALGSIRLTVIRQPHAGAGAARNTAVRAATEPYLAFLDADDEWLPRHLERCMAHMESGDYVLVAHNGWHVDGAKQSLIDGARRFRQGRDPFVGLYRKGYIDTCTVVARRAAVVSAGGFDPGLANAQDFEMWLALLADPQARFLVFDEPLSRYHVVPGSIMSHTERRLQCCLRIAARHAHGLEARPGAPLTSLWFRVAALHWEAVRAHAARRRAWSAAAACLALPARLAIMTLGHLLAAPSRRPDFIAAAGHG
jgi:glycosyltransferase involved in cell wall biosynthesis